MRRVALVLGAILTLAAPLAAAAQPAGMVFPRPARIGVVHLGVRTDAPVVVGLRQG